MSENNKEENKKPRNLTFTHVGTTTKPKKDDSDKSKKKKKK